jgi:hypothetical protein
MSDTFWHLSPFVLMFGMVALNHLITHRRVEKRYALEAFRLRVALLAELRMLKDLYIANLRLIDGKANYLLSGRSAVFVYRANLGRLTSLFGPAQIDCLVKVFARNELVESMLTAHAVCKGGLSYQLTPDTRIEEVKQMYESGVDELELTRQLLEQPGSVAAAAQRSAWSELRGLLGLGDDRDGDREFAIGVQNR